MLRSITFLGKRLKNLKTKFIKTWYEIQNNSIFILYNYILKNFTIVFFEMNRLKFLETKFIYIPKLESKTVLKHKLVSKISALGLYGVLLKSKAVLVCLWGSSVLVAGECSSMVHYGLYVNRFRLLIKKLKCSPVKL